MAAPSYQLPAPSLTLNLEPSGWKLIAGVGPVSLRIVLALDGRRHRLDWTRDDLPSPPLRSGRRAGGCVRRFDRELGERPGVVLVANGVLDRHPGELATLGWHLLIADEALRYAKERIMFGKPIGATQLQQQRLADMLTGITQGQLLALQLGRLKDRGVVRPQQVSLAKRANVNMAIWPHTSRSASPGVPRDAPLVGPSAMKRVRAVPMTRFRASVYSPTACPRRRGPGQSCQG